MNPRIMPMALCLALGLLGFGIWGCDPSVSMPSQEDGDNGADGDESTPDADDDTPSVNYPGAGTGGAGDPLQPGVGPENCAQCSARVDGVPIPRDDSGVLEQSLDCFYSVEDVIPAAAIEQLVEILDGGTQIHIRLTLDPRFVDNTYGKNSIGWADTKKGAHQFKDLVGSDHAEMKLFDTAGKLVLHFKVDYVSEVPVDDTYPAGYGTLGVSGGDGKMILGNASAILGAATSLDRNLNGCGLGMYLEDSPLTDAQYTPNPEAPVWDYRVVYEVWVDAAPFGQAGFGDAKIESVHASPSKMGENTIIVLEGECPDDEGGGEDECNPKYEDCDTDDGWADPPI